MRILRKFIAIFLIASTLFSNFGYMYINAKSKHESVYYVDSKDEFYTVLFDELTNTQSYNVKIVAKGSLARKLEKTWDKYNCIDDFHGLDPINAKSYVSKYKNRQVLSYNDIASAGLATDYDTKKSGKTGKTNYFEITMYHNSYKDVELRKEYENFIKPVLIKMDLENKSDVERVKTIVDWICDNTVYGFAPKRYQSGPYAILTGDGVCENYADLTTSMLDGIGIDCMSDEGGVWDNYETHAWNLVKIKNKWYNLDTYWIDCGLDDCFLKSGTSEIFKERNAHRESEIIKKQYKISNTDCVDDGYSSPLRAWLIGITDSNVKTTVGKKIPIKKDRLTKVTSSDTSVAVIKNGKIVTKKKGRTNITRTDGKYKSEYYVLVE